MADHVIHISEAEAASDFAGLLAHVRAGVTVMVALRVGQIDGENQAKGVRLPLADLLIGVTALELGYSVATGNLRHFQMIPGLAVVQF